LLTVFPPVDSLHCFQGQPPSSAGQIRELTIISDARAYTRFQTRS